MSTLRSGSTVADRYIAVIDAGTSSVRCFVFDRRARIVAARSCPWPYATMPDAPEFAREFDVPLLWRGVSHLLADALQESGAAPGQVAAVTATSQRQGVVFLDALGREIYAGPNRDLRAVFEGGAIDDQMRERVYRTTGHTPSFLLAPAKLRWFQLHRQEAYDRISSVLTLADWLVFRLSGEVASEPSLAAETGLLDVRRRRWCSDLQKDLGLIENGHVPLVNAATMVGRVTKGVAGETGLPAGTPVVVSGADTQCGLLGMGVMEDRQAGIVAGWSAPVQMATVRPVQPPQPRTWTGCHVTPNRWVLESNAGDVGNSYRWLADTLLEDEEDVFTQMEVLADGVPAGSEGTLAFLGPSRMDMDNLGLRQGGFLFPVPMTATAISRGHMVRSALEAVAYAVKANLQQAECITGESARTVSVGGGMTHTAAWVKILADSLAREVTISAVPQVSAFGAYLCAATALGEYASLEEAAESAARVLRTVEPEPLASAEHQEHFERWTEASARLETISI